MFSSSPAAKRIKGFTLIELLVVIAIIAILAAILFPVFAKARAKARQAAGQSNQKQISLAILAYLQDFDEKYPPTYGYTLVGTAAVPQDWAVDHKDTTSNTISPGIIQSYAKNNQLFQDPSGPRGTSILSYMYNDLIATKSQAACSAVASTVLTVDGSGASGDSTTVNGAALRIGAGHAVAGALGVAAIPFTPTAQGTSGLIGNSAGCGAACDQAKLDDVTRQSEGSNLSFADGHVKWFKVQYNAGTSPAVTTKAIYFPAASNTSATASTATEPQPGGDMKGFAGTFHLN